MNSATNHPPLSERMRPTTLDHYYGQEHLVGQGAVLREMVESDLPVSFILWGPPGVGKTTLAKIVATSLNRPFHQLSAINSGVKELREIINQSRSSSLFAGKRPILFIDEIHRFNKGQQDALLGAVEDGTIMLIGATTENPSFEVNPPLLSRCRVFILKPLDSETLDKIVERALKEDPILSKREIKIVEKEALYRFSGGDGRKLLNILEILLSTQWKEQKIIINNNIVTNTLQENILLYDKSGDHHYDIISAFIKTIRASQPDAALYWLARMIEGGEDPKFIARRLIISASEDIGLANPNALLIANAAFDAVEKIGMPEGRIVLSQATIYLATSPKSRSAYEAIGRAIQEVKSSGTLPVPLHLRNAPTKLMEELGYGKLDPDNPTFMPKELTNNTFYKPGENSREEKLNR